MIYYCTYTVEMSFKLENKVKPEHTQNDKIKGFYWISEWSRVYVFIYLLKLKH